MNCNDLLKKIIERFRDVILTVLEFRVFLQLLCLPSKARYSSLPYDLILSCTMIMSWIMSMCCLSLVWNWKKKLQGKSDIEFDSHICTLCGTNSYTTGTSKLYFVENTSFSLGWARNILKCFPCTTKLQNVFKRGN